MAPTRRERKKKVTKMRERQILDAAKAVFSAKGFAMATTAEIAGQAGVAEGTIYNYFPSKHGLFVAVIKDLIITTPLLDLIEKIPVGDIGATFKQIMLDRFRLVESQTMARIPSLMGEIQRDPELKALWLEQFLQPFLAQMDGMYRFMMASGQFRKMEPAVAVRAIGGLILGFLLLRMMEGEASPLSKMPPEKVAEELVDFVGLGMMNDNEKNNEKEVDS
jgi:AcrR family transcriptional regulator